MKVTLSAPCHFGLESVLSSEIRRMGGENVQVTDGRVTFDGDENLIARANIGLRVFAHGGACALKGGVL